jgi:hypothetical protein
MCAKRRGQVDVVDGEYQTLATALDSSQDFESLQTSLDQFLKALHVQCFLSSPLVRTPSNSPVICSLKSLFSRSAKPVPTQLLCARK